MQVIINKKTSQIVIGGDLTDVRFIEGVKIYNNEKEIVFDLSINKNEKIKFVKYKVDSKDGKEILCDKKVIERISDGYILEFYIDKTNDEKIYKRYVFEKGKFCENYEIEKELPKRRCK